MSNGRNNGSNGQNRPPENDYGMPLQQILQLGQLSAQLLSNPAYNIAHRMAIDQAIQEWASTQPKEREKRESLYYEVQALGRVAQTMAGMVERAQQASEAQNAHQANSEQDYLDRQGFGLDEQLSPGAFN